MKYIIILLQSFIYLIIHTLGELAATLAASPKAPVLNNWLKRFTYKSSAPERPPREANLNANSVFCKLLII